MRKISRWVWECGVLEGLGLLWAGRGWDEQQRACVRACVLLRLLEEGCHAHCMTGCLGFHAPSRLWSAGSVNEMVKQGDHKEGYLLRQPSRTATETHAGTARRAQRARRRRQADRVTTWGVESLHESPGTSACRERKGRPSLGGQEKRGRERERTKETTEREKEIRLQNPQTLARFTPPARRRFQTGSS